VTLGDRIAVVTNRPGRIKEIIDVDLPRPRSRESRHLPEFDFSCLWEAQEALGLDQNPDDM
jgi:ABC-type nitrate/sulfonate/bicarbonate transport system ATPase subunit